MSQRVFLHPGEWYFGAGDMRLETLLGSCVSLTLWSAQSRIGGMCHFLLPTNPRPQNTDVLDGRYGADAVLWLQQQARSAGIQLSQCEVKVFGGSRAQAGAGAGFAIGENNIHFAVTALESLGITPCSVDVGGYIHRYLRFELATGDVWVRHGSGLPVATVKQE
jgi:chemotaxis protein CheD